MDDSLQENEKPDQARSDQPPRADLRQPLGVDGFADAIKGVDRFVSPETALKAMANRLRAGTVQPQEHAQAPSVADTAPKAISQSCDNPPSSLSPSSPSLEEQKEAIITMLVRHRVIGAREAVDELILAVSHQSQARIAALEQERDALIDAQRAAETFNRDQLSALQEPPADPTRDT